MTSPKPPKAIGLKKALNAMHVNGTRLVKMHTTTSPDGAAHYIVPGGYVTPETAEKIKNTPGVWSSEDGLFPGCAQTWRMGQ